VAVQEPKRLDHEAASPVGETTIPRWYGDAPEVGARGWGIA
jgi:hypothetical protein